MSRNMKQWLAQLREMPEKKALPVLSFPAVQLMGISVRELISDSDRQAQGMKLVADRTDAAAAVSLMDRSCKNYGGGRACNRSLLRTDRR